MTRAKRVPPEVPMEEWRWFGMPGHLIVSDACCFHLVTVIGEYKVSTIGCYHPRGKPKDYAHRHPIGAGEDSLYETYVFRISGKQAPHESAQPGIEPSGIDGEAWATEPEAEAGHLAYCRKYATLAASPEREVGG